MRTEFLRFRSRAARRVTAHTTVYFGKSKDNSRLSIVVPVKVNKRAVVRNWLKRLAYDTLWPKIEKNQNDCVVVFKPLPLTLSPATLKMILSEIQTLEFN